MMFAANERFLEDVPVNKILDFEAALLAYMNSQHGDFMRDIDASGRYDDAVVATLRSAITTFKATNTY